MNPVSCFDATPMASIASRKTDHIDLCAKGDVGFRQKTTLLECVEFLHRSLPEMSLDDVDTSVSVFGKHLKFPILISAMTGGTAKATEINRQLAQVAEERGYGFGLGSQRPLLQSSHANVVNSYAVRDVAPKTLIFGNLGIVQAKTTASDQICRLIEEVGADAICIHMNPAMELIQPGGDRYFGGGLKTFERLVTDLPFPVIAKETGCGISESVAKDLTHVGVRSIEVSGAGGTSWVAVETERATDMQRRLGLAFRDWGIPTAASIGYCRRIKPRLKWIIASGGIYTGMDAAKAIAFGANLVGVARPVLVAWSQGGIAAVHQMFDEFENELKTVMLLVGARNMEDLRRTKVIVRGELNDWVKSC